MVLKVKGSLGFPTCHRPTVHCTRLSKSMDIENMVNAALLFEVIYILVSSFSLLSSYGLI